MLDVKLLVDGVYRADIKPMVIIDDLQRELVSAVTSKAEKDYLDCGSTYGGHKLMFDNFTLYERTPKYLDYMYMNDYLRGWNTTNLDKNFDYELGEKYYKIIDPSGKPLQVSGRDSVVYLFENDGAGRWQYQGLFKSPYGKSGFRI